MNKYLRGTLERKWALWIIEWALERVILKWYKIASSLNVFIFSGQSTGDKQFKMFHMERVVLYDVNQHKDNQIREDAKWVEFDFCINYNLISSTSVQSLDTSRAQRAGRRPHDERENTIPNNSLLLLSPSHWAEETAY